MERFISCSLEQVIGIYSKMVGQGYASVPPGPHSLDKIFENSVVR